MMSLLKGVSFVSAFCKIVPRVPEVRTTDKRPVLRTHAAAGQSTQHEDPFTADPELQRALDESFQLINEIVTFVCNTMVADHAVAYVTINASDTTAKNLLRQAVEERLTRFNHMTLHTLHSMLQAPLMKNDRNMRQILEMLKEEILRQTGHALPEEIRLLDELVKEKNEEERLNHLQEKSEVQLEALALTCGQIISDMEETPAIADVPLLCSMVILRDEVLAMLEHKTEGRSESVRVGRSAVPQRVAAVLKELVRCPDVRTRRVMLFSELKEGCKAPKESKNGEGALTESVRPGALMHSLDIIRIEMETNPPEDTGSESPAVIAKRLWDIKADALHVICRIRDGKLANLSP